MYIVFDLDDTLLNDYHQVSEFTLKVLRKLQRKGHKLVINTARSKPFAQVLIDLIQPDYSILNGGSQIIDYNQNNIYLKPLSSQIVNEVVRELQKISKVIGVQTLDKLYTNSETFRNPDKIIFDFNNNYFNEEGYKIFANLENHEDGIKIAKKYKLDYISYFDSKFKVFRHIETGKDKGLINLMNMCHSSLDDCISFGDDEGDIKMLQISKVGVIMKNAKDKYFNQVKYISKYSNDEDGVAKFLIEYFNLII